MKPSILKILICFFTLFCLHHFNDPSVNIAACTLPENSFITVQTRANKIIWKYKFISGTLYKRKYNVTQKSGWARG